jgi:hypothetical protein
MGCITSPILSGRFAGLVFIAKPMRHTARWRTTNPGPSYGCAGGNSSSAGFGLALPPPNSPPGFFSPGFFFGPPPLAPNNPPGFFPPPLGTGGGI